jgi:hypothetical protein
MWADFQQSVVIVAGDGIWAITIVAFAGSLLLAMLHIAFGAMRRILI